jgi:16S rRNA (guanine527-N7)-methyltransferase
LSVRRGSAVSDLALAERIRAGASALSIALDDGQLDRFVAYLRLIGRWNATYNLTSVRDPEEMATQHVVDCLAAAAALKRRRIDARIDRLLDVGSGAGLPGLVLAVVLPETEVVCIDSVGKKTAFVTQAAAVLRAGNAIAVHGRVEALAAKGFDVIASRAFAALEGLVSATRHLLADNGEWLAMKGKVPQAEIDALTNIRATVQLLVVPSLSAERCIVWMSPRYTK